MTAIRIVKETKDTVTVSRQDWSRLLAELEDAEDRSAVRAQRAREEVMGKETIRQNSLTGDEARRLLDGESAVRVWRGKRGLTQRGLAAAAGVAASYLSDIENGRKPGSADALSRLARALGVSTDDLMDEQQRRRDPGYGPVYLRSHPHSPGIGAGGRGANLSEQRFASVQNARAAVRDQWPALRNQAPEIVDEEFLPIFGTEDLWREMEPELFDPDRKPPILDVRFEQACKWSRELSSYVTRATVDGETIRCRVKFPEDLHDLQIKPKDFARIFQQNRQTFEHGFREAIVSGRFGMWLDHEANDFRRDVVLDIRDFHVLVGPRL